MWHVPTDLSEVATKSSNHTNIQLIHIFFLSFGLQVMLYVSLSCSFYFSTPSCPITTCFCSFTSPSSLPFPTLMEQPNHHLLTNHHPPFSPHPFPPSHLTLFNHPSLWYLLYLYHMFTNQPPQPSKTHSTKDVPCIPCLLLCLSHLLLNFSSCWIFSSSLRFQGPGQRHTKGEGRGIKWQGILSSIPNTRPSEVKRICLHPAQMFLNSFKAQYHHLCSLQNLLWSMLLVFTIFSFLPFTLHWARPHHPILICRSLVTCFPLYPFFLIIVRFDTPRDRTFIIFAFLFFFKR